MSNKLYYPKRTILLSTLKQIAKDRKNKTEQRLEACRLIYELEYQGAIPKTNRIEDRQLQAEPTNGNVKAQIGGLFCDGTGETSSLLAQMLTK